MPLSARAAVKPVQCELKGFVEQKLVLLDVGFAGVSSVWMTSKVGLGLITVSKLWDGKTAKGPTV